MTHREMASDSMRARSFDLLSEVESHPDPPTTYRLRILICHTRDARRPVRVLTVPCKRVATLPQSVGVADPTILGMNLWAALASGIKSFRPRDPWWDQGPDNQRSQKAREQAYRHSLDMLSAGGPPPEGWGPTEAALEQRAEFIGAVNSGPWMDHFIILEALDTPMAPGVRTLSAEGRADRPPELPVSAPALALGYCRQHAQQPVATEEEWWFDSLPKATAAIGEVEIEWFSPAESYDFFTEDPPRTPDFADN